MKHPYKIVGCFIIALIAIVFLQSIKNFPYT